MATTGKVPTFGFSASIGAIVRFGFSAQTTEPIVRHAIGGNMRDVRLGQADLESISGRSAGLCDVQGGES